MAKKIPMEKIIVFSGILRDKSMKDKLMYIPNNDCFSFKHKQKVGYKRT